LSRYLLTVQGRGIQMTPCSSIGVIASAFADIRQINLKACTGIILPFLLHADSDGLLQT